MQTRDINLGNEYYSDVFDGEEPAVRVKGFDERGRFVLGNGLVLKTPILCYGGKVFVWEDAAGLGETGAFNLEGIEPADLSVLRAVKPKPDILVVGSGERRRGPPAAAADL